MKKRMYFIGLIILLILTCSNIKTNKKEQQTIVDSTDISVNDIIKDVSSEKIIEKKRGKYIIPTQIVDSIIGGYHIYYEYLINITELIPTESITNVTGDTLYFAGTYIQLLLDKDGKRYFQKCFNKDFFLHICKRKISPNIQLQVCILNKLKKIASFLV